MASDFNGYVPAISVIYEVFERNHHITAIAACRRHAVVIVRNRNETHTEHREYLFDIPPCLNIVPAETGQVFYNDTVDRAFPYILQHALEVRAVKIDAAVTVIRIHGMYLDFSVGFQKVRD